MKKSEEPAAQAESAKLEFPDWSGMDDSSMRISPDSAFQVCEQYAGWFADAAQKWPAHRPEKCLVEFIL
ncbi:MAG TPA: hypothetical protein VKA81_02770 [Verrucomicrobiae bacterium]|nr:hypothetical protein [Verrucomicrobiae bacterium]